MPKLDVATPVTAPAADLIAVTDQLSDGAALALTRARTFAEPLIAGEMLDNGENTLDHADAVAAILKKMGGSEAMQAASYLVYACNHLNKPREVLAKSFGEAYATLALETTKLVQVQQQARAAASTAQLVDAPKVQTGNVG